MSIAFVRLALIGASVLVVLPAAASAARKHPAAAQTLSMEVLTLRPGEEAHYRPRFCSDFRSCWTAPTHPLARSIQRRAKT
jgi:hypothetical protein